MAFLFDLHRKFEFSIGRARTITAFSWKIRIAITFMSRIDCIVSSESTSCSASDRHHGAMTGFSSISVAGECALGMGKDICDGRIANEIRQGFADCRKFTR
jgi:hypothetical protein